MIKTNFIKFNNEVISKINQDLLLNQFKQVDLICSRNQIKKSMTFKNQYVTQHVKNVYIAILSQFETSYDLSVVAQIINSKKKNVKKLNKRF